MSALFLFRSIENKHDVYRGKYCMKHFCEFLRECTMKTINFKKKKIKFLRTEQESYENAKIWYICWEKKISEEFKKQFACLGEYTEKYITFTIPTLHKKWSFPLRISSVNVTKSAGNFYWRNPWWKTSFFVQCNRKRSYKNS